MTVKVRTTRSYSTESCYLKSRKKRKPKRKKFLTSTVGMKIIHESSSIVVIIGYHIQIYNRELPLNLFDHGGRKGGVGLGRRL